MAKFKLSNEEIYSLFQKCNLDKLPWKFIYRWQNKVNGKSYIGRYCGGLRHLINRYKNEITYEKYSNRAIHKAMNKYGIDNFRLEFLENCDDLSSDEIDVREEAWIRHFKSNQKQFGYNLNNGGKDRNNYHNSSNPSTKVRMYNGLEGYRQKIRVPVYVYDLEYNYITEYNSYTQCALQMGLNYSDVYSCATGKMKRVKTFRILTSKLPIDFVYEKPIYVRQYDLNGNLIKNFYSPQEVRNEGFDIGSINYVQHVRKNVYKGFIWKK